MTRVSGSPTATLTIAFDSELEKDRATAFDSKESSGIVVSVHTKAM